jgi:hypothetical protein
MAAIVPFALAPALVGAQQGDPIDYSTRAGQNLFTAAVKPLPYIFEGRESSVVTLLQAVRDKSAASGWNDIFSITIGQDAAGNDIVRELLTHYGEVTLTNVRENALTDYIGLEVRNAQISTQIYQCLRESISAAVSERLVTETENYFFGETPDGPALLKTLIDIYLLQTKGTPTQLRLAISQAPQKIVECGYDIDSFNTTIDAYVQQLASSGETTQDMFAHLSQAYKLVPDKNFKNYITAKVDAHDDRSQLITARELMSLAKNKFDELTHDKIWMTADSEAKLVTLTIHLEEENNQLRKRLGNNKPRATSERGKPKPKAQAEVRRPKPRDGSKSSKWDWKLEPPNPGQATRHFEGKAYFWCTNHKAWCLHKTGECRKTMSPARHAGLPAVYEDVGGTLDQE